MYKATQTLEIKQNNSFSLISRYTDDNGAPMPLDGLTITADVKDSGKQLITAMQVNVLDATNGLFELTLPQGVTLPSKALFMDVRLSEGDIVRNTDIVRLDVSEVVTYG